MSNNRALELVWDGFHDTIEAIVNFYTVILLTIFPFYASNKYFRILRDRTRFFLTVTECMVIIVAVIFLVYLNRYLKERYYEGLKTVVLPDKKSIKALFVWLKNKITIIDACFLLFLFVCILSTIFSEWPKAAFWGDEGRYQGSFLWFWYGVTYFFISRFVTPRRFHFDLLIFSGVILSLWGITDYIGFDIFGWIASINEEQRGTFTSSFGNINTYTAAMSIYFAVAGICILTESNDLQKEHPYRLWLYCLSFLSFTVSLITGRSDNAVIAIAVFFLVVPFFCWRTSTGFQRYVTLLGLLLLSFATVIEMNHFFNNPYVDIMDGIFLRLCSEKMFFVFMGMSATLFTASYMIRHQRRKKRKTGACRFPIIIWGCILAAMLCFFVIILLDANFGTHPGRYAAYEQYLVFTDSWGTGRGFCWRLAVEHFMDFPLWIKLIGSGPETYGLVVNKYNYQEMLQVAGQLFDSTHNEFLQYLFTTGIIGTIGYYGFLIFGCINGISSRNKEKLGAVIAVIVYTCVSFVNISVPITQPYIIVLMAFAASKKERRKS